jgi:hypothetical protein
VAASIISPLVGTTMKLSSNSKIRKYRKFHEGHHFISMAMEVYGTFKSDMDHFIKECACLFHDLRLENHLSLLFCIQFFKQCVSNTL